MPEAERVWLRGTLSGALSWLVGLKKAARLGPSTVRGHRRKEQNAGQSSPAPGADR